MKPLLLNFIVLLLFTTHVDTVNAQIEHLRKGVHVRILAPAVSLTYITGDINEISDRGILLDGSSNEILFEEIDQLERGNFRDRTGRGMLVGTVAGAFLGGTLSVISNDTDNSNDESEWFSGAFQFTNGEMFLFGAIVGVLPGALIGGVVGSTIETIKWKAIRIEPAGQKLALRYLQQSKTPGVALKWSF